MELYYLPLLVRSDRYFISRLESGLTAPDSPMKADFNFVIPVDHRVVTPLLTIENPSKVVLNQMAPMHQDIPLSECTVSLVIVPNGFRLELKRTREFSVQAMQDENSGLCLDYSEDQKRLHVSFYSREVSVRNFQAEVVLIQENGERFSSFLSFGIVPAACTHRVVIDFGSEASQIGYRNCGPESVTEQYDILENLIGQLNKLSPADPRKRSDFLNCEEGQPMLYRSFYAVRKQLSASQRENFPFNFTEDLEQDELRLFITRKEAAATHFSFRDEYAIIPNLKLGIEKSLQLSFGNETEDYSIRSHQQELISAVLLRILRLMLSTKPSFRRGGLIITLLVPNIYTQHAIFSLLSQLRDKSRLLLESLKLSAENLILEFETISESDSAFMGYQQTHPAEANINNGEIALVIDCGKGTTDISMLLADTNSNYSSFFRTGFAGAGNVLLYGFVEDFLTIALRAVPGNNDVSIKDFISRYILTQNLTADVLNFIQLMEEQKKRFRDFRVLGLETFSELSEQSESTERTIANLHKDLATVLPYSNSILNGRSIRWDDTITGLIDKATDSIVHSVVASIRDVITPDIKKRIKVVMLTGRAFYFSGLREKMEKAVGGLLESDVRINTIAPGRAINNKNVAIHGAFTGAYKITDFTGIPIDRKEGLSCNKDVLNNNGYLYRGFKIEPGNDILYNTGIVRRNHLALTGFKNRTVDIYFTRDNIYLRLMENQHVKEVRSLYQVLTTKVEHCMPLQDLRAISMFPAYAGELVSIAEVYADVESESPLEQRKLAKKKKGVLQFFNF